MDDGLEGVQEALDRARKRAIEVAIRTGTPLVIFEDGQIRKVLVTEADRLGDILTWENRFSLTKMT